MVKQEDLVQGQYYTMRHRDWKYYYIYRYKVEGNICTYDKGRGELNKRQNSNSSTSVRPAIPATPQEEQWLDSCIKANKFIPLSDIDTKESLLEEAKRRYPIGTKFKAANNLIKSEVTNDDYRCGNNENIYFSGAINSVVYYKGKWAEIIEPIHVFEIGDEVEIINPGNIHNTWKEIFIEYKFRDKIKNNQLKGFSGTIIGLTEQSNRVVLVLRGEDGECVVGARGVKLVTKVKHNKVKKDGRQDKRESNNVQRINFSIKRPSRSGRARLNGSNQQVKLGGSISRDKKRLSFSAKRAF